MITSQSFYGEVMLQVTAIMCSIISKSCVRDMLYPRYLSFGCYQVIEVTILYW